MKKLKNGQLQPNISEEVDVEEEEDEEYDYEKLSEEMKKEMYREKQLLTEEIETHFG